MAVLSNEEYKMNTESSTAKRYGYMFYIIDNIDYLIAELNELAEDETAEITPPKDIVDEIVKLTDKDNTKIEQTVQVDDTSANISGIIYLISMLIIIIGGTIIYKETQTH